MLRRILVGVVVVLALVVLLLGGALVQAHRAIDRERAPLPTGDELARFVGAPADDLPVRLTWIDTASQPMPRAAVLDPGKDPAPHEPYVMSFAVFVLEWTDGRILLIDAGMRRAAAVAFGRPLETFAGAAPLVAHTEVGEALGDAAARVRGILFTHLHSDHVDGVVGLCAARGNAELPAFMTVAQAERPNYTTRPGLKLLDEAGCVREQKLPDGASLRTLPGFPGVAVIDAGGHTPGSEIILARVAGAGGVGLFAFAGDTVNNLDGVLHDVAKPFVYRTFLIPESDERQGELRRFLAALAGERGFTILVSHDELALRASKVPTFASDGSPRASTAH